MLHVIFRRSRRAGVVVLIVVALLLLVGSVLAGVAGAQTAPAAIPPVTYVYLRGTSDTVGIEVITRSADRVRGVLTVPNQPRVEWEQRVQAGAPAALSMQVFAPGAPVTAAPVQRGDFVVRGDSVQITVSANGQTVNQAMASRGGAYPLVNASLLHAALLASHALRQSADSVPLFLTAGAQTIMGAVRTAGDTVLLQLAGQRMAIFPAPDGLPRQITVGAQGVRVVRADRPVSAPSTRIDYSAPASAPYSAAAVRIPTPRGYALAGTLTKPHGMAKVPVVITISGSGPQERDSRLPGVNGYAIFREIADTLGRRGVAVLRYDDRGVGESGGGESRAQATTADFADDVRAVVAWLRTRPDIDGRRIALVGHSEGGIIAPMVAATDSTLRAVALLAGTGIAGRQVLEYQRRLAIDGAPGLTAAQRDSLHAATPATLDSAAKADPWYAYFMSYDPRTSARLLRQPVLILHGLTDTQVTPDQADTLALAMRSAGNRAITLRTFPATNHLFLEDPTGQAAGYPALKNTRVRREVLGALADWMVRTLR